VVERGLDGLNSGYRAILRRLMRARPVALLLGLAVAGSGYYVFTQLNSELAPYEDTGTIIGFIQGPVGSTIGYTDRYAKEIEDIFSKVPEIERYFVVSGVPIVSQGIGFAGLRPWTERKRSQPEIILEMMPKFLGITGVLAFPIRPPPLGQNVRDKPVQLVIQTTRPYSELQEMVDKVMAKARTIPGLQNIDSDLRLNKPQLRIIVDRDKAADLGLSAEVLGRTLETLLGGRQVTRFKREGRQYDVVVQIAERFRTSPTDIPRLYVRNTRNELIQLANLVRIEETVAPQELNHFNKLRAAKITANLAPGTSLSQALSAFEAGAREVLPSTALIDLAGQSREFKKAGAGIYFTFVLALAFIYLVLAAQFESFRDPLIIMLTVPLSIAGGLVALWLDGSTLNIYSQVGLVTLIGLITKHGILIVDFANQRVAAGATINDAVVDAAAQRLRPILMTTGAMVFGAVPLAIASGAGAESRQDIGLVIVGGLLVGTLFTLFVIPAVYTYLARPRKIRRRAEETVPIPAE
jgi:multidrug efflux pump